MPLTIEQQRAVAIAQAKRKRAEAEAKAPPSPLRAETDAIIEEAAAAIPGGYEAWAAKPADPKRMAALGYTPDPLAKSGYSRPRAPQAPIVDSGQTTNLFTDAMRMLEAPIAGLTGGASGGGLEGWAKTTTQNPLLGATEAVNFLSPVDEAGRAYLGLRDTGAGLIDGDMGKAAQGAQQASIEGSFAGLQALPGSMTLKGLTGPARAAPNTLAGAQKAAVQASRAPPVRKSAPQVVEAPATTPEPFSAPAEPKASGFLRNNADRIVGGGVGAFAGGAGDAIAAEGDGSGNGPDIINPVTGGLAGLIVPRAAARGYRGIRDSAGFNQRVASRAVRNVLAPVGRTAEEVYAAKVAQVGDKPATLADLTQQGQNLAVGLTRLPGQAGQLAVQQSEDVLRTRTGRLFSDVETTTKINPASVAGDLDEAIKAASEEISPAYEQLFAKYAGVNSERLMQLADDPIVGQYVRSAIKASESLATTAGQAPSNARIWDLVKRGLDRTIEGQKRSSGQAAYELEKARAAIKDELDALMPDYKAVRDAADAPRMRAARKEGAKIAGGGMVVERVRKIASGLKGKPLTALQMGAVEKLALDIEKGRGIDGIASERMREILGAVFDDDTAAKLVARIRADQTIIKNAQRRNPNLGSATSQATMGGAGGIQNAADLAQNALALKTNPLATVLAALSKSGAYTKAQRDLIAQMLLGGADPENLARIYGRRGGPTRGQPTPPAGPPVNPLAPPRRPPEQAGFVTPGALAPLVGGSGGLAYGEFAPLQDMDRDGDTDADDRQAMRMSYGLGGLVGGGLVGGGLAGAGANRLLGPRRGGAPKVKPSPAAPSPPPEQFVPSPPTPGKLRAYHGSPHSFDAFESSNIGTGEGAASYGRGLYFAENLDVAKSYQSKLSRRDEFIDGEKFDYLNPRHVATKAVRERSWGTVDDAIGALQHQRKGTSGQERKVLDEAIRLLKSGSPVGKRTTQTHGTLYEVDIDASADDFLDWDKPLGSQTARVKQALEQTDAPAIRENEPLGEYIGRLGRKASEDVVDRLKAAGVPGIRYLDQGSRGAGEGSRNLVLFDDKRVSVVNRFGGAAPKTAPQKLRTGPGFGTEADYLRAVKEGDDAFRASAEKITQAGGFGDYKVSLRYPIDSELRGASFNVTKNGEVVGTFDLYSPGHTQELSLHAAVKPEFQRQGVATQFYDFVESTTGKRLRKSETMSPEGKALWDARERRSAPQKPPAQSGFGGGKPPRRN